MLESPKACVPSARAQYSSPSLQRKLLDSALFSSVAACKPILPAHSESAAILFGLFPHAVCSPQEPLELGWSASKVVLILLQFSLQVLCICLQLGMALMFCCICWQVFGILCKRLCFPYEQQPWLAHSHEQHSRDSSRLLCTSALGFGQKLGHKCQINITFKILLLLLLSPFSELFS